MHYPYPDDAARKEATRASISVLWTPSTAPGENAQTRTDSGGSEANPPESGGND